MKTFHRRFLGILIVLVGLLAGTAYWYRSPAGEKRARDLKAGTAQPRDSDTSEEISNPPADEAEAIVFPQGMWDSANLRIAKVKTSPMTEAIELTGKIALNEDKLAHLFPLVEGRVDDVKVRFGQHVKKDDLLVVVQSKEVGQGMLQLFQGRLNLELAEARLRWTQDVRENTSDLIGMIRGGSSIEDIEQTLNDRTMGDFRERLMTAYLSRLQTQAHRNRLKPLSESGAVPARQLLEAETNFNTARASLQSLLEQISHDIVKASRLAEQKVKELQTNIAVAETNLKILGFHDEDLAKIDPEQQGEQLAHYPVTAPFDGTVISKDVVLMESVGPDRQILTIADLSTVWVTADIYETHLPLLAQLKDHTLKLRCDAWPDQEFEATVFYTGDVVQETTRTIALRAEAENTAGLLKPGMFVTVELLSPTPEDVLQVPLAAIQNHEGQSFVFVQTGDEMFARHDVTVGRRNADVAEIRSGLHVDDRVVVDGGFALKSKMLANLLEE